MPSRILVQPARRTQHRRDGGPHEKIYYFFRTVHSLQSLVVRGLAYFLVTNLERRRHDTDSGTRWISSKGGSAPCDSNRAFSWHPHHFGTPHPWPVVAEPASTGASGTGGGPHHRRHHQSSDPVARKAAHAPGPGYRDRFHRACGAHRSLHHPDDSITHDAGDHP